MYNRKNNQGTTPSVTNEIFELIAKKAISFIPLIDTLLNDCLFENRSRIKQDRLNSFTNSFAEYMVGINESEIDIEYIKSDDFSDIFESIVRRVMLNGSKEKATVFKNVLLNHILGKNKTDHSETFLDILSRLNEKQIIILDVYRKIKNKEIHLDEDLPKRGITDLGFELRLAKERNAGYFGLDKNVYQFYIQDLFAKGLLFDDGINQISVGPFQLMEITQFGMGFLSYIEKS